LIEFDFGFFQFASERSVVGINPNYKGMAFRRVVSENDCDVANETT